MRLAIQTLIDPRLAPLADSTRDFYRDRGVGQGPSGWDELQEVRAAAKPPTPSHPPAILEVASHGERSVPVRIHLPSQARPRGVVLDLHGGGFYMGSAAAGDVSNQHLADALAVAVVSVEYRLAPEDPWPAAPDDCETAALWLTEHAADRFGTTRLVIGGFSAGATLAMTTLTRMRDRDLPTFRGAVLQFGTYDLSGQTPAGRLIADEYFIDAYSGGAEDRAHPDFSPIYAHHEGLPPVMIVVGEEDILLRDNLAMSASLVAAGGDVDLRVYPAAPHGFTGHATAMAEAAHGDIRRWLGDRLEHEQ
jgi:acetyl esterase